MRTNRSEDKNTTFQTSSECLIYALLILCPPGSQGGNVKPIKNVSAKVKEKPFSFLSSPREQKQSPGDVPSKKCS